ncbi:M56 family metallopeptidase [Mycolicibacterium sp. lyk4-40-TYG-92]|uniref:M56 family metallopeptidase n=1 Tax=Mycolicibacterium sp. lyk4-40-TYG-92 TaxID=3040295 RepID=UPI00254E0CCF|nr:M56 family metallopeptidase [Mycolicibacterium sp. lyk4-40-TYG-92]
MSAATCLALYYGALVAFGPRVLAWLTRGGQAPRAGVAAWLIAVSSFLLTGLTICVLIVRDVIAHWGQPSNLVVTCVELLCDFASGAHGSAAQIAVITAVFAVAITTAAIGVGVGRRIHRLRGSARHHCDAVRMVGQPLYGPHVYVLQAPERAAYAVAGRPPAIVVTSSAVDALGKRELHAVIAHERAHVAGHHLTIATVLRALATALPHVGLLTRGAEDVARLLEMCADDAAARRYGRRALLAGLVALVGTAPAGALGAADIAVLHRAARLACPATGRAGLAAHTALIAAATVIASSPIVIGVLDLSGTWMCPA